MILIKRFLKKIISIIISIFNIISHGGVHYSNIMYLNRGEVLKNKNVIITGGSSGIGYSIAKRFIDEGARVLIIGKNLKKLEHAKINISSPNLDFFQFDLKSDKFDYLINQSLQILDFKIDILINNAGTLGHNLNLLKSTVDDWNDVYFTNSRATFFISQKICELWMKEKNKSAKKIINISSQGGYVGATYPYRLSKWDINGLTKGLGKEMAKHNIIVNGIAPGIVATDMQPQYKKQNKNFFCNLNPLGRFCTPDEIAEVALFLSGDNCNFIVGQTIICDGGFVLK